MKHGNKNQTCMAWVNNLTEEQKSAASHFGKHARLLAGPGIQVTQVDELDELLRAINVSLGDKEQEVEKDAVNIMSMHQAKGLTAVATFVVAVENEYLPGRDTRERAQDATRLLYVSVTRAQHFLFLTHCNKRTGAQRRTGSKPDSATRTFSRFLSGGPVPSDNGVAYCSSLH